MQYSSPTDRGEIVTGQLNTADASAGVPVPLFDADGTSRSLGASEQLTIDSLVVIATSGGDVRVFWDIDNDNALDTGETIFRGDVSANGGVSLDLAANPSTGPAGVIPHVLATAGNIDVTLRGRISKTIERTDPQKPHYVG